MALRTIDYHCRWLSSVFLMSYLLHATTSITVTDHVQSEEHDDVLGEHKTAVADEAHPEKVTNRDENAENKHFMDVYALQSGPKQLEFGHVFEDPNIWEQRYEKKDFENQRYQGKVKWGDKDGGYGEQYWDLNHGGAGESANDDEENERLEETIPTENIQESRRKPVVYKPMVITFVNKNKSKKPIRTVRKNQKITQEPSSSASSTGNVDKKTAPVLVFDMKTGVVMDEATGNRFILKPLNE